MSDSACSPATATNGVVNFSDLTLSADGDYSLVVKACNYAGSADPSSCLMAPSDTVSCAVGPPHSLEVEVAPISVAFGGSP